MVRYHINSNRHQANVRLQGPSPQPNISAFQARSTPQSSLYKEMAEAFITAGIPFQKLDVPEFRDFMSKWMRQQILRVDPAKSKRGSK